MAAGSGASHVGCGDDGAQSLTPPSDSSSGVKYTPKTGAGSGPVDGVEVIPSAESNSSALGSIPTTKREFNRANARLANMGEHLRNKLKGYA